MIAESPLTTGQLWAIAAYTRLETCSILNISADGIASSAMPICLAAPMGSMTPPSRNDLRVGCFELIGLRALVSALLGLSSRFGGCYATLSQLQVALHHQFYRTRMPLAPSKWKQLLRDRCSSAFLTK